MTKNKRPLSTIGGRVQSLRLSANMNQSELAKIMRVSRETLNYWESDAREIKANQILKLSEMFGVTCDYILQGTSTENVEFHRETGLNEDAINQLRKINNPKRLFPLPVLVIEFFNYMLSSPKFVEDFSRRLEVYYNSWQEDNENTKRIGKFEASEETEIARYYLGKIFDKLLDDSCNYLRESFADRKEPRKSGRKKKEIISDSNNAEN